MHGGKESDIYIQLLGESHLTGTNSLGPHSDPMRQYDCRSHFTDEETEAQIRFMICRGPLTASRTRSHVEGGLVSVHALPVLLHFLALEMRNNTRGHLVSTCCVFSTRVLIYHTQQSCWRVLVLPW